MPFFVFIDPSRTRPGTVKHFHSITYVARELGSNTRPQKSSRNLRRLIRVLRLETWDSAGACGGRKIREDFVGYFGIRESEVYTVPQNLRFELLLDT